MPRINAKIYLQYETDGHCFKGTGELFQFVVYVYNESVINGTGIWTNITIKDEYPEIFI